MALAFILLALGGIALVAVYAFFVAREWRLSQKIDNSTQDPIVPVNLVNNDNGVLVAEGRGRLVYANDRARQWFGMNGNEPNLTMMAQRVQPSDTFRDIFAHEGRVSFRVGKRYVEATSHAIPADTGRRIVVVMRELQANGESDREDFDPVQAMSVVGEISAMLTQSFELEATLEAILHSISEVVKYDASEVNYWQVEQNTLRPIARLGDPNYAAALDQLGGVYKLDEGYTGWIARYRQPLVIGDVNTRHEVTPRIEGYPFNSFIGVPLMAGDRFIGTLELAGRERHVFDYEDLTLLQTLAGQVAVALENSRLYREQSNRVAELSGLQEIAQAMSNLTDPRVMFRELNESIARLMNVQICAVMLLTDDSEWLVAQPPLAGVQDPIVPLFKIRVSPRTLGYRMLHENAWWYSNTTNRDEVIHELELDTLVEFGLIHAMAIVPMVVGNNHLGAVLVANPREGGGFNEDDMQLLAVFAAQVAIVVENARLYNEEQRRAEELEGLQQIAQAIGVLRDPVELFTQITERIATLMDTEVCGVFILNPENKTLVGQPPFCGVPDEIVKFTEIPVNDLSIMQDIWDKGDPWFANDLLTNGKVVRSDLGRLAAEAEMSKGAVALLKVGGQSIGMILAANKVDGSDFDEEDARLLNIFAGQAAVLVDNARLYTETHQRAIEADNLRQIAEQLSGAVSLESVVQDVLQQTSSLIDCEMVAVGLLDTKQANLTYTPEYFYGREIEEPYNLDIFSPGFSDSVVLSRRIFRSGSANVFDDRRVLPAYRDMARTLGITDALIVPLVIQGQSIGELAATNKRGQRFSDNDESFLQAVAAQISGLIERSRLYQATDSDLRDRVEELNAVDRIWQELALSLDLDRILEVTRNEVRQGTPSDGVTLTLIAPRADWMNEDEPLVEKRLGGEELGNRLAAAEATAFSQGVPTWVQDYLGSDLEAQPSKARSAIIEPMQIEGQTIGLVHAYSNQPNVFSEKNQAFLARLTQQTTMAVTNAQRYREQIRLNETLRGRAEQLSKVYSLGKLIRQGESLRIVLDELAAVLSETVGFRVVMISLRDDTGEAFERVAQHGLTEQRFQEIRRTKTPLARIEQLFHDERWLLGNSVFMPAEAQAEDTLSGLEVTNVDMVIDLEGQRAWNQHDLLLVPLYTNENQLLGWISVDAPVNGRRPTPATIESLEVFAREAAFSVENYRLLQRIRTDIAETRAERDRLALLHLVASDIQSQPDMPTSLQVVVNGIQAAGWDRVRLTMRDDNLDSNLLVHAGYSEEEAQRLNATVLPGSVWRDRFNDPEFEALRLGASFYLRYDAPWVQKNTFRNRRPNPESVPDEAWHPQDVLFIPLYGRDKNRIIGLIGLEAPADGRRPDEESLQPIELFANQAAAAMENTRLYLASRRQAETEQRLTDMMEALSASLDLDALIRTLADGLQQMIAFTRMHVALPQANRNGFTLRRVEVMGDQQVFTFEDDPVAMEGTAMGLAFAKNDRLIYNLSSESDTQGYDDLKRWYSQGERITMMVPMITGGETLGVLRLGSELENAFGFRENVELVSRLANLSAISIDHTRLVDDLMASTNYNEAVVESIQQGIVVLDSEHNITSINAYMKQRYDWEDRAVNLSLYEYQPDFEEFLQHSIDSVLETGTPQHQFEVQDKDAGGNKVIRNFYTYPLRQAEGVSGAVLLIEDVTERSILESDLAQRAEQMRALTQVSSTITSNLSTDDVLNVVLEALEGVMPYDGVSLWLREGKRLKVISAKGFADEGTASVEELLGLYVDIDSSGFFREMSEERVVINVGDTGDNDPRFPHGAERIYRNWLGAPMISQSEVVGVIALEKREPYYYTQHHEQLLLTFANQAAIALNNAQLFEQAISRAAELDEQTKRLELLNRVNVDLAQSLDIENIFEITLRETALAIGIREAAAINIDTENDLARIVVEYPRGEAANPQRYSLSNNHVFSRLRESMMPIMVDDFQTNPMADDVRMMTRKKTDVQSSLLVPLTVGGTVIGALRFDNLDENYGFTTEHVEIAQTISNQAAVAVQNASLFEQSVVRTHELETLFEAAQATAVTLDLDEAMRRVVNQMLSALRADACTISIWDDMENKLEVREIVSAWGDDDLDHSNPVGTIYDVNEYPVRERVLRQREVAIIRADNESADPSELAMMKRTGARDRILVPLVVNDISIGLIEMEIREQNRYFETADVRLARTLATQAAVAIENARLQTETRGHIEELYIINDLSTAVSSTQTVDDLFPMVRDQLPVLTDADVLYLVLYDKETELLSFPVAVDSEQGDLNIKARLLGDDEFSSVIKRRQALLLAGANLDDVRKSFGVTDPLLTEAKCYLGVPLASGDEVLGVLAVQDNEKSRAFTFNDRRILTTVASQLGVAIQNARLFQETQEFATRLEARVEERTAELEQERNRVETLYEITSEVAASLDLNRVLSRALERVAEAIGASSGVIMGMDEISDRLFVLHSHGGLQVQNEGERTVLRQNEGLAGWVIQNHTGVVIQDVQDDPRWVKTQDRDLIQRSAVAALLEVGDDVRGVMMLFDAAPYSFNEDHLKLVSAAASQLANSMKNAELYALLRDQAERLGAILRQEQVESTKTNAIMDSVADGVLYANEQGTVVLFNNTAERILGLPAEQVVSRPITELAGLYGGSSGEWLQAMERWMNDPADHRDGDFVEILLELEDGRTVSVRLSPVNMGDQFLGTVSVFRDITKAMEVDRLKSEFVATVSHELRTPMTSIKGYADLLLLGAAGDVSEAQQRFLETIKQNADRLSILVNDLLEVSRIDQNRVPMRFTAVDVEELLDGIAKHLQGRIEDQKREMSIVIDVPDHLPAIRADYERVIRIIQNLADNAFNYTPDGGTITLSAREKPEEHLISIQVVDTGVGIPKEIQSRIFERFFRGDEFDDLVMDTPGTGLGLSIVKSLVDMHEGDIRFNSEMGHGTTFFVDIPIADEAITVEKQQ